MNLKDYIELLEIFKLEYIEHLTGNVPRIWVKNPDEKYGWSGFRVINNEVMPNKP